MKILLILILWAILFALCWPLAILVLVVWPVVWLLSIPLRLLVAAVNAFLALMERVFFLPARLLGHKTRA